ncbi:hypothetical protein, partial [Mycobacterium timonense]|uniref:hypothetical protein n=1 Tax=Mycobacterium timonense TaxID=701043 RepID=UPI001B801A1D
PALAANPETDVPSSDDDDTTVVYSAVASRDDAQHEKSRRRGHRLCSPMNPHRPRKPRKDGAALRYLQQWRKYVELTESVARKGDYVPWVRDCPCCDPLLRDDSARSQLESLMCNGGRRAHRLRAAVARLDERFRAATIEQGVWRSAPWWDRRRPRDW